MAMNHLPQLVDALERGELALFIGADLPQELTGLPSRTDLATDLAKRLDLSGPPPLLPEVAAQYESLWAAMPWSVGSATNSPSAANCLSPSTAI